jgi:hypothetical protein
MFVRLAPLALALTLLAGCRHVAPYEREQLARPTMDHKNREAQRAQFQHHVYESREGAMPTSEHAGGGCGCN